MSPINQSAPSHNGIWKGTPHIGLRSPVGPSGHRWILAGVAAISFGLSGCRTFSADPLGRGDLSAAGASGVGADEPRTIAESTQQTTNRLMNFLAGREHESLPRSKRFYQEGEQLFVRAKSKPRDEAIKDYRAAAKRFRKAAEAAPGSAYEQDALFMQAESLFFADRLTQATEIYQKLQKDYPRSRHTDRVAARLFAISRYWIATVKADEGSWMPVNLTDAKKPRLDVDGHAIRVLDQIRYDDPTGRLADDATMAAAAEFIRQEKYERADEFLTDLREAYTDSDHLFLAHLLGIRCKLEVYSSAGKQYSGLMLEEAEKLVRQTRTRFPDQLREAKYADLLARAAAEIEYLQAERYAHRAEYREKRHEYGAARYYYHKLLEQHGKTPQAEIARERLAAIEEYPAVPKQQLAFLTKIFPDSQRSEPLETTLPTDEESADSETMLR